VEFIYTSVSGTDTLSFVTDLNDPIHVGTTRLGKFLRAPDKEDLYSARGSVNENALWSVAGISDRMDHSFWDKHCCALLLCT
jgi:hypothetical protein